MEIILIVAADENNGIGMNNRLPWHLPADFKMFKNTTMHHHVLMGRKTFQSMGSKPLQGRDNIIVTHKKNYQPDGCEVVHSVEKGIEHARKSLQEELFVIGGAEIFKQTIDKATRILLTRVHYSFNCDTFFPKIYKKYWEIVREEYHESDDKNYYNFSFMEYRRIL